jgi:hypothetical protein
MLGWGWDGEKPFVHVCLRLPNKQDCQTRVDAMHVIVSALDTAGKLLYYSIQSAILHDLIGQFSQLN